MLLPWGRHVSTKRQVNRHWRISCSTTKMKLTLPNDWNLRKGFSPFFMKTKKCCFFHNTGTIDLFRCGGIPMIGTGILLFQLEWELKLLKFRIITGSAPHFYLADPALLEAVESGLEPVREKHATIVLLELVSNSYFIASRSPNNMTWIS